MIYFAPEITRQVIENIYKGLVDGGFLFIGFSETLWQVSERFKLINNHDTFYYQKPYPHEPPPKGHATARPSTGPLGDGGAGLAAKPIRPSSGPLNGGNALRPPTPDQTTDKLPVIRSRPEEPLRFEEKKPPKPPSPAVRETPESAGRHESSRPHQREKPRGEPEKVNHAPPSAKAPSGPLNGEAAQPDWKTALDEGLRLMEADDFDNAAKVLKQALEAGPHEVDVLCAVAHLKVKLGEYNEAIELSTKAASLNPLSEQAHLLLAMLYQQNDRIEEAIKEFQQTIFINMDSVIAHIQLGDIWNKRRESGSALREYRSALRALEKHHSSDFIEGFPVETLKRTCLDNIRRLQGANRLR